MNKYGETTKEFKPGQAVVHIPDHVKEESLPHPGFRELNHEKSAFGVVKSVNDKFVFVQFFPGLVLAGKTVTAQACNPERLYYYQD